MYLPHRHTYYEPHHPHAHAHAHAHHEPAATSVPPPPPPSYAAPATAVWSPAAPHPGPAPAAPSAADYYAPPPASDPYHAHHHHLYQPPPPQQQTAYQDTHHQHQQHAGYGYAPAAYSSTYPAPAPSVSAAAAPSSSSYAYPATTSSSAAAPPPSGYYAADPVDRTPAPYYAPPPPPPPPQHQYAPTPAPQPQPPQDHQYYQLAPPTQAPVSQHHQHYEPAAAHEVAAASVVVAPHAAATQSSLSSGPGPKIAAAPSPPPHGPLLPPVVSSLRNAPAAVPATIFYPTDDDDHDHDHDHDAPSRKRPRRRTRSPSPLPALATDLERVLHRAHIPPHAVLPLLAAFFEHHPDAYARVAPSPAALAHADAAAAASGLPTPPASALIDDAIHLLAVQRVRAAALSLIPDRFDAMRRASLAASPTPPLSPVITAAAAGGGPHEDGDDEADEDDEEDSEVDLEGPGTGNQHEYGYGFEYSTTPYGYGHGGYAFGRDGNETVPASPALSSDDDPYTRHYARPATVIRTTGRIEPTPPPVSPPVPKSSKSSSTTASDPADKDGGPMQISKYCLALRDLAREHGPDIFYSCLQVGEYLASFGPVVAGDAAVADAGRRAKAVRKQLERLVDRPVPLIEKRKESGKVGYRFIGPLDDAVFGESLAALAAAAATPPVDADDTDNASAPLLGPPAPARPRHGTVSTIGTTATGATSTAAPTVATTAAASSTLPRSSTAASSSKKLDTVAGVFLPVFLSIWGLQFYLRFGVILGYAGVLGTLAMLGAGYAVTTLTTLSVSAISTNGRVRAGGAYYMISRCLGAEFGGSIGAVYYVGSVLGGAMSAVGFVEPLLDTFGDVLPDDGWAQTGYATALLAVATLLSFGGAAWFAKLNKALFVVLNLTTISALGSLFLIPHAAGGGGTGPSWAVLRENLFPTFTAPHTAHALFGLLFPACAGILAGASMSGELRTPSQSIPRGTLAGIGVTGTLYIFAALIMGSTLPRAVLQTDLGVLGTYSRAPQLYTVGIFSAAFCAVFGGVLGTAQLLRAILRDRVLPLLPHAASPRACIAVTWLLTQLALVAAGGSLDALAPFYTTTTLLCYATVNLACLLLRVAGAPNFRPAFRYFGRTTAAAGLLACLLAMLAVDAAYAAGCILVNALLFAAVHYAGEPKDWGDVSLALAYHQVRRLLLKMDRRHASVKAWRPQILYLVPPAAPAAVTGDIRFANDAKKGALFVVGVPVIGHLHDQVTQVYAARAAWRDAVVAAEVKALVHVAVAPTPRAAAAAMLLGTGLGSLAPNIVLAGFPEGRAAPAFLGTLDDAVALAKSVGVLRHFRATDDEGEVAGTIDIWPLCFTSAPATAAPADVPFGPRSPVRRASTLALRTDPTAAAEPQVFDDVATWTLVLQLGAILATTDRWRRRSRVRVFVVVERRAHAEDDRRVVRRVVRDLRIDADIHVVCLEDEPPGVVPGGVVVSSDDEVVVKIEPDEEDEDEEDDASTAAIRDRARFQPPPRRRLRTMSNKNGETATAPAAATTAAEADPAAHTLHRLIAKYSSAAAVVLTPLPPWPRGAWRDSSAAAAWFATVDALSGGPDGRVPMAMLAAAPGQVPVTTQL
ncbi:hypothetical protein H9P43_001014 [Blastocladiella emersonii ATCC 22665]|nr:hypothetical protein H9P43_001014 [Blastocladiella emersonii ATCC 22665]